MDIEIGLEETVICSNALDERPTRYTLESIQRLARKIKFKTSKKKIIRENFKSISCAVPRDGRYIISNPEKHQAKMIQSASIKLNTPEEDIPIPINKKAARDIIQIRHDLWVFLSREQHPCIYKNGKPVSLQITNAMYHCFNRKSVPSFIKDNHIWYPSKNDGSMQGTGMVYARIPVDKLLARIDLLDDCDDSSGHIFDAGCYLIGVTWPFADCSFVGDRYLMCLSKNGRFRTIDLLDNKYTTRQLEGRSFGSVLGFSPKLAICSKSTIVSEYMNPKVEFKSDYHLIINNKVEHIGTYEQVRDLGASDSYRYLSYCSITQMIRLPILCVPTFMDLMSGEFAVIGTVLSNRVVILSSLDLIAKDNLISANIVDLHCIAKHKVRAFTKNGEHFTITIKL